MIVKMSYQKRHLYNVRISDERSIVTMKKSKRLLGIAAAGLIGAGSLFSGAAVTGLLQQAEVFAATDVAINATNFPNKYFREYVLNTIDKDKNKKLSSDEIKSVTSLDTSIIILSDGTWAPFVDNIKGIEYFTNLETLSAPMHSSLNKAVMDNLKSFTVYGETDLKISSFDFSKCKNLKELKVNYAGATMNKLDLSKCSKMETLDIQGFTGAFNLDASTAGKLKKLKLDGGSESYGNLPGVTSLNLSDYKNLEEFSAKYCSALTSLDVSSNNKLKSLGVNDCSKITSIKVGSGNSLESVYITYNEKLKDLDLSKTSKLKGELHIQNNDSLANIKMGNNKGVWVNLNNNNLKTLDASGITSSSIFLKNSIPNIIMSKGQSLGVELYDTDEQLNWSSSNSKIALFDKTGKTIKAINTGTAKLTLLESGKRTINVTVVDNNSSTIKTGWKNENGGWKYYKDGKAYTGWHKMGKAEGEKTEHWSYFGKDGKLYTGWRNMGKNEGEKTAHWSYFGPNGWLRTGWQQMGKGTNNPDGNAKKHWSYFGSNGWLRTSWQWMDKSQGEKTPHWSYFGGNGWLRTGMVTLGKADGEKVTHKSYFGGNGWLVTNKKFSVAGKMYTADGRGWIK